MLSLSDPLSSIIIKYLVIAQVSRSKEKARTLHDLSTKVRIAVAVALVDSVIISGISFFSSMIVLGSDDIMMSIKISFYSSMVLGGLTFFNELKKQVFASRHGSK